MFLPVIVDDLPTTHQPIERSTAIFHFEYLILRPSSVVVGKNDFLLACCTVAFISHTPQACPAAMATPRAVTSTSPDLP